MTLVQIRSIVTQVLSFAGQAGRNLSQISFAIAWGKFSGAEFIRQSIRLIFSVIMPVIFIAIALGVVIGVQLGPEFISKGLGSQFGIVSAITMTRELIPVVGCLMIATQYGTGIAAEFANMKITEQVDVLRVQRINPIEYLVVPRFMAAVVFVPLVIWLANLLAITSSYLTVWIAHGLSYGAFLSSIMAYFKVSDILLCLFKASVFGALLVLIASTLGLEVEGGAKEVGKATTATVILSFIAIVAFDYIITVIYL